MNQCSDCQKTANGNCGKHDPGQSGHNCWVTWDKAELDGLKAENAKLLLQIDEARKVIEAARHRVDCPHYHSFPSDVSSSAGICCQAEAGFQMALLEWDRKYTEKRVDETPKPCPICNVVPYCHHRDK